MSMITTHVLDLARGCPAAGIRVRLDQAVPGGTWTEVAVGVTDGDGRVGDLLPPDQVLAPGNYRLVFETRAYRQDGFYPEVPVVFAVGPDPSEHYHVPLLLSPHGYSTYRGS